MSSTLPLGDPPTIADPYEGRNFQSAVEVYREPQPPAPVTPMGLLQVAMSQGADLAKLEQLMALQERWEANEARKAYVSAMARFKRNPPDILKRKRVYFENKAGGVTDYMHATLADVCAAAIKGLAEVGISHRWDVEQQADRITVHCVLTHELGHSEKTTLTGGADPSGGKNSIQAIASAVSYLERYTLLAATGLATRDMDNDGRAPAAPVELITEAQALDLEALISEVGANRALFLKACKIERLEDMPAGFYPTAVNKLKERGRAKVQA